MLAISIANTKVQLIWLVIRCSCMLSFDCVFVEIFHDPIQHFIETAILKNCIVAMPFRRLILLPKYPFFNELDVVVPFVLLTASSLEKSRSRTVGITLLQAFLNDILFPIFENDTTGV